MCEPRQITGGAVGLKHAYKFQELRVGMCGGFSVVVTAEMLEKFRVLSGDDSHLHANTDYMLSKGFKGVLLHGAALGMFYSRLVGKHLPGEYAMSLSYDLRFKKPVYVGDCLQVSGRIVHLNEAFQVASLKARIENINDEPFLVSTADILAKVLE
ncbi:(R)-hydratase [Helicobacter sp. NHP19-012]|uniref:(R)-hydratase n=2 Tax=Helicobacter TaxID=209 RepID=A0ABN6IA28_9HELI|nr:MULTISPECIES: MaoC/PaaZ C-terminal domain-containing protein [Helicobacter]BCZ19549.1 (R)-hydratase [Helicobacter sp. NHP19-012]BEG56982.1 MaoC family dehydratase [Helicobacter sp. NHP21005]